MPDSISAVMTVAVRDVAAERDGGPACVRIVTISAFCPVCLGRRGEPELVCTSTGCCDGTCWTDVWHNDCGHADNWASILAEAAQQCARPDCVLDKSDIHDPYCSAQCAVFTPEQLHWYRLLRSYLHRSVPALVQLPVAGGGAL